MLICFYFISNQSSNSINTFNKDNTYLAVVERYSYYYLLKDFLV